MKIHRCDDCKKSDAVTQQFIVIGGHKDPADNRSVDCGVTVDLCGVCAAKWVNYFVKAIEDTPMDADIAIAKSVRQVKAALAKLGS